MYDRFQQLAFDSSIALAIVGTKQEFVLLDLSVREWPEDICSRGYSFLGLIGLRNSEPHVELAARLDHTYAIEISRTAATYFAECLAQNCAPVAPSVHGDSVQWLEALWSLEDPRPYPRPN